MTRHAPWTLLSPGTLPEHADDIAEHYAREFAVAADGEARWLRQVASGADARMVRAVLAKALVRAAIKLEADAHGRSALALGNAKEAV